MNNKPGKVGAPKKKTGEKKKSFSVLCKNKHVAKVKPKVKEFIAELENQLEKEKTA